MGINVQRNDICCEDSLAEGGGTEDAEAVDDDVENIDFNNYTIFLSNINYNFRCKNYKKYKNQ